MIRGPRVLGTDGQPGGSVVAAVDEAIHYTPRKAGYHGGASLAEVVIPVITLLPSPSLLPDGWYAYDAASLTPRRGGIRARTVIPQTSALRSRLAPGADPQRRLKPKQSTGSRARRQRRALWHRR